MNAHDLRLATLEFDEAFDRALEAGDSAAGDRTLSTWHTWRRRYAVDLPAALGDAADKLEELLPCKADEEFGTTDMSPVAETVRALAADLRATSPVPTLAM